jgi:dsDNA-binding SOS-regulon protein
MLDAPSDAFKIKIINIRFRMANKEYDKRILDNKIKEAQAPYNKMLNYLDNLIEIANKNYIKAKTNDKKDTWNYVLENYKKIKNEIIADYTKRLYA